MKTPTGSRAWHSLWGYRVIFALAAAYNLCFGTWVVLYPYSFFMAWDMALPRYPSIWACLGMVVGLYGMVYAYVAWRPEQGTVFVWIGLVGKVLGPIGWWRAVWGGELPPRTFPLILLNDLIWWFPFLFFVLRGVAWRRTLVAWSCVAANALACLGLLSVRAGTEAVADISARMAWVATHVPAWTATWMAWSVASMSLLAFVIVWSGRLVELSQSQWLVLGCCLIVACGVLFDLAGENVNISGLTRPGLDLKEFARGARAYALLGPAAANGLYCVAGLTLSGLSWRSGLLRGGIGVLGFCMWTVGIALTLTAVAGQRTGMVISGGGVMALFLPWATLVGWRLRPTGR